MAGGLNLYGFAGGDPVNFSDPFGLCPEPPCENPIESGGGTARLGDGLYGAPRPWKGEPHAGEDELAPLGTPVHSPVDGTVAFVRNDVGTTDAGGRGQEMGNNVLIRFTDSGGSTRYWRGGHLAQGIQVAAGDPVTAGQVIGRVGASGNAAVAGRGRTPLPMLHSEFRANPRVGFRGSMHPVVYHPNPN